MTEDKKIDFYNHESTQYSRKRYGDKAESYTQFFFNRRRQIVIELIKSVINNKKNLSLLDIACADGVITHSVDSNFPGIFSKLIGVDISPLMVDVANKNSFGDARFSFFTKNDCPVDKFDIVLGTGYLSKSIFDEEMVFLKNRFKSDGYYICTLASSSSIYAKIKLRDKPFLKDYDTYSNYRNMLNKEFEILTEVPYGLFIPKLWAFPKIAAIVQPILENLFKNISPNLFHEKVYLLKNK